MNETPVAERVHIGFFGACNVGKSSLVNAITGQDVAVVSQSAGTTTDTVYKTMELLPAGPVVIIDTPGIDDTSGLGALRVERTRRVLRTCDVAVLVCQAGHALSATEKELVGLFQERNIPYVLAANKSDSLMGAEHEVSADNAGEAEDKVCDAQQNATVYAPQDGIAGLREDACNGRIVGGSASGCCHESVPFFVSGVDDIGYDPSVSVLVSALTGSGIETLKGRLARVAVTVASSQHKKQVVADLLEPGDVVVLVVPIDASAPKGRIILPQQMVLRDVLDAHARACVCQPAELPAVLQSLNQSPRLVITDSQVFSQVAALVPRDVLLTSFSILMARYKGDLHFLVRGAQALSELHDGSKVLISEGCTHHRQCEDIGTVKMPAWIRSFSGVEPEFSFTSGGEFPENLSSYDVVVHCGGCMLNEREMRYRMEQARLADVPMVNYGVAIAHMNGILNRCLELFLQETNA